MSDNFAVLDDSMTRTDCGIFVYTHCLINNGFDPVYLTIVGDQKEVRQEEKIFNFVENNLIYDFDLYACSHYFQMYNSLLDLIDFRIDRKCCRNKLYESEVIDLFKNADTSARNESRRRLDNIIKESLVA